MSTQNQRTVQLDHLLEAPQRPHTTSTGNCEVNVKVANGWAITGHYRNNALQAITLQKISQPEETSHG